MKLVLGSGSPRRLNLLTKMGFAPDQVISSDIDETPLKTEIPKDFVARICQDKANALLTKLTDKEFILLTGDTIVSMGRSIIGKAESSQNAKMQLLKMSGRSHTVYTSIFIVKKQNDRQSTSSKTITTKVRFKNLLETEIDEYIATNEWQGRAGSYSIDGIAGSFIKSINGSPSNVTGLPMYETKNMLLSMGLKQNFKQ